MTKAQNHPLVGWAFLSCTRPPGPAIGPGECHWQGEILAVIPTGSDQGDCALVEFFSWATGATTFGQLIPLTEFTKRQDSEHFYKLFPSNEERKAYYDRVHGPLLKQEIQAEAEAMALSIRDLKELA
jgi:hypothetical protein